MTRYLLIATAIVFLVGGAFAAIRMRGRDLRVASVQTTASPSPPRREAASTFTPGPVTGTAPWALSAVPECFHQTSEARGSASFALAHLPGDAAPLRSGAVAAADCVVTAAHGDVLLARGAERLRVPHANLYVLGAAAGLGLLTEDAGQIVVRVYRPVGPLVVRGAPEARASARK